MTYDDIVQAQNSLLVSATSIRVARYETGRSDRLSQQLGLLLGIYLMIIKTSCPYPVELYRAMCHVFRSVSSLGGGSQCWSQLSIQHLLDEGEAAAAGNQMQRYTCRKGCSTMLLDRRGMH